MKNRIPLVISLVLFITTFNIQAGDKVLLQSMKQFHNGMTLIQDGFFYNNENKVKDGINLIEKGKVIFDNLNNLPNYLPENKSEKIGFSFYVSRKIGANLAKMSKALENKDMSLASEYHAKIINNCSECHVAVRDWYPSN